MKNSVPRARVDRGVRTTRIPEVDVRREQRNDSLVALLAKHTPEDTLDRFIYALEM